MKQAAEKQFKCTICDRWFTRIDHLKRHQLRRLIPVSFAVRPSLVATTCGTIIKIAPNVEIDLSQKPANEVEGGMPCTSMKLRCDGGSPCSSCQKRNLPCTRQAAKPSDDSETRTESTKSDDYDQTSERGSVKFLLNGGADSFTKDFRLPSRHDRAPVLAWPNHDNVEPLHESLSTPTPIAAQNGGHTDSVSGIESQPVDVAFYNDGFLQFFNGGYNSGPRFQPHPSTTAFVHPSGHPIQGIPLAPSADQYFEPESPYLANLIQSILSKSWILGIDEITSMELMQELRFLLTTQRVQKFISLYFQNWHMNCPMLHRPSFNPETVTSTLLAAVALMGSMYSENANERLITNKMLDLVEMFIFSADVFSSEFEIAQSYKPSHAQVDLKTDWTSFQHLQAGYLMFLIQYWGGNRAARNRVVEVRLAEVIKVARQMQLTKCQHSLEDQISEYLWLQKECRIRTMILISMIDSAMPFYHHYPSRLPNIEVQCDMPCEESLFSSRRPFLEPNFRYSREMTVYQAFHNLFTEQGPVRQLFVYHGTNKLHLQIMDMFLLIHHIYSYIHMHMNISMPLSASRGPNQTENETVTRIKLALEHWRSLWISLRTELPSHEWETVGFFKGAYNFWLVSQLLISKQTGVDILMKMDVNCDDKLSQLKVLLPDDNDCSI
ncbi:hypothetical protein FQN55_003192 [Onygenales sp. PD_40]|nr:hypothetical protein FQN55_003192 [Onygenales sp. PD_40]KAK2791577.1 hypothetical protein FQN52_004768 [Onygenales sp. PD_12]